MNGSGDEVKVGLRLRMGVEMNGKHVAVKVTVRLRLRVEVKCSKASHSRGGVHPHFRFRRVLYVLDSARFSTGG